MPVFLYAFCWSTDIDWAFYWFSNECYASAGKSGLSIDAGQSQMTQVLGTFNIHTKCLFSGPAQDFLSSWASVVLPCQIH